MKRVINGLATLNDATVVKLIIREVNDHYHIVVYNMDNETLGYSSLTKSKDKMYELETICCFNKYQNNGVASLIIDVYEFLLKDIDNYIIKGMYFPYNSIGKNQEKRPFEILDINARAFYNKKGFKIMKYDSKDREKFAFEGQTSEYIIYKEKEIKEDYGFKFEEDTLIQTFKTKTKHINI